MSKIDSLTDKLQLTPKKLKTLKIWQWLLFLLVASLIRGTVADTVDAAEGTDELNTPE